MEPKFVNAAAYKFVELGDLPERRRAILARCREEGLRGTVLLSPEGINLFVAGPPEGVDRFLVWLRDLPGLADLEAKLSPSDHQPFTRMLVRLKREIIALGQPGIQPRQYTSRRVTPQELRTALDRSDDVILLDVRNDYEVELGTFDGATPIGIDHFRKFPEAAARLPAEWKQRNVVMFCTGGIRCEKAGPVLEQLGFENVRQLDGGILKYFEEVGGSHYHGDCFVFDKRVAVDPQLRETDAGLCFACQAVLSPADQSSPKYRPPRQCPYCYESDAEQRERQLRQREAALRALTNPLPGRGPYCNLRPLNVPARFDGWPLLEMLNAWHDHLPTGFWQEECLAGRLQLDGQAITAHQIVRAGMRTAHLLPETCEPEVSTDVKWIFEDEDLVVLAKPAPLPVHPCGRFSRNTLTYWLNQLYGQQKLRPAHRLDANTTGLIVFSRTLDAARRLQPQFEQGRVVKTYLALVQAAPAQPEFVCDVPIGDEPMRGGGRAVDPERGQPARTEFRVLRFGKPSLLECCPLSGRTNQIRIHLRQLGLPIVNDPLYGGDPTSDLEDRMATLGPNHSGLCLHAWKLNLVHPRSGEDLSFEAPPPDWGLLRGTT